MTPELYRYVVEHGAREDELLRRLRAETGELGDIAIMQTAPEQGALMTLLARAIGARRALEVGTFTGYSAICIARGLVEGGTLLACELSEKWAAIAGRYFVEAGLGERIELAIGPALETVRALPLEESLDLAFIDADKPSYSDYYEEILPRLRPGGLLLIDNVLWGGRVVDAADRSEQASAIRGLNEAIAGDERVDIAMLPVADGVTVCLKR